MLLEAKKFAIGSHGAGTYGTYPYSKHLNDVYNILVTFGIFEEIVLALSWTHDTIEDTQVVFEDVKNELGVVLAEHTYLISDKRGRNRRERHENTYPELAKYHFVRLVKIADRIANVTMTMHDNQEKFIMYAKEQEYFKTTLQAGMKEDDKYHETEVQMWKHLETLIDIGPFIEY